MEGVKYLQDNPGIKALVMGISGGIDSALTAAIAREICDSYKRRTHTDREIVLIGFAMPIVGNDKDEMERAADIGRTFCHQFQMVDLNNAFYNLMEAIDPQLSERYTSTEPCSLEDKIRAGNIKARVRMINLYNRAQMNKGMVLSTDNYTEFMLGFWTLHGDVGDYGFIQEMWKTEVYDVAEWLAVKKLDTDRGLALHKCVAAKPTDGLGVSDSDIAQLLPTLPASIGWREAYRIIDDILIGWINDENKDAGDDPVIARHLATAFKRANPISIKRELLTWVYNPGE